MIFNHINMHCIVNLEKSVSTIDRSKVQNGRKCLESHVMWKMYQVDAFTQVLFKGNPAAVIVLDEWLSKT